MEPTIKGYNYWDHGNKMETAIMGLYWDNGKMETTIMRLYRV